MEDTRQVISQQLIDLAIKRPAIQEVLRTVIKKEEIAKDVTMADAVSICKEWQHSLGYTGGLRMKDVYHPHPQFFYGTANNTKEQLKWLNKKLKRENGNTFYVPETVNSPEDAITIINCMKSLMSCIGATRVDRYIKTSKKITPEQATKKLKQQRKAAAKKKVKVHILRCKQVVQGRQTCVAKFKLSCKNANLTRKSLPEWANKYHPDYVRALKFAGEFAGRVYTWYDAWLRSQAMLLAKVGLLHVGIEKYKDRLFGLPLTCLFLALASSEFGKRKEFTLESQKQGGLNPFLERMLSLVKERESSGIEIVAYMLPAREIWSDVPRNVLEDIHSKWLKWMPLLALSLEDEWIKGAWKCPRRSMRVLPGKHQRKCGKCKGCTNDKNDQGYWYYRHCNNPISVAASGVNSSLWNVVADAWTNGSRILRGLDLFLGNNSKCWLKVLQMVANDQFRWATSEEKPVDPNVKIFDLLTRQKIFPWHVAHPQFAESFDNTKALATLLTICDKDLRQTQSDGSSTQYNPKSWIGLPCLRKAEVKTHTDMICGVSVCPMSQETFEWVSNVLKPFGATGWNENKCC